MMTGQLSLSCLSTLRKLDLIVFSRMMTEQLSLSCLGAAQAELLHLPSGLPCVVGGQLSLSCLSKLRKLDTFMFSRNDDRAAQPELPRSSSA